MEEPKLEMSYYIYFISSLPMLHFGVKPPLSSEKFIGLAERFLPKSDLESLARVSIGGEYEEKETQPTALKTSSVRAGSLILKKWQGFDTALRNELVKARAAHKHSDPFKYLRHYEYSGAALTHLAINAHRNPSILEAEKMLDQQRWRALDELAVGHYFDLDFLIVYALKLLILERWERISTADKTQALEEVLVRCQRSS